MEGREWVEFAINGGRRDAIAWVSGWKDAKHFVLSAETEHCTQKQFISAVHSEVPDMPSVISREDGYWIARGKAQ